MAACSPPLNLPPSVSHQNSNNLNEPRSSCKIADHTCVKSSFSLATPSSLLPSLPISSNYAIAMDSCNCPALGRQIHADAIKRGFFNCREFSETRLLCMYGRCGCYSDACKLFDRMPHRSMHSWAGILTSCVDNGFHERALALFQQLCAEKLVLNLLFFVFPVVLKACGGIGFVEPGKELHGLLLKRGFISNIYVSNALIDMYGKCGALDESLKVFDTMEERDCVSWNSMIAGCAASGMPFQSLKFLETMQSCGDAKPNLVSWSSAIASLAQNAYDEEALWLLRRMLGDGFEPNARTLASIFPCSGRLEALGAGKEIHGYVIRHELTSNSFIVNGLIDVYSKCGDSGSALELFQNSSTRNLVSYNSMIAGYSRSGNLVEAMELFHQMELDGLAADTASWNSILRGHCEEGNFEGALEIFRELLEEGVEADSFTVGGALSACSALAAIREGKEVHSYAISTGLSSNPFVSNSSIEMYCRCHDFISANLVFHTMDERDAVAWNLLISCNARADRSSRARELLGSMKNDGFEPDIFTWNGMIAGCMENERNESVLEMLYELQSSGLKPDVYTVGMVIPVCSRLLSIGRGKEAHSHAIRRGYDADVRVGAALVDMYAKCGAIGPAALSFERISRHNPVSFNSLLAGYAMHGLRREGLALFREMLGDGIMPDAITFLSVLSLCVHAGSVEDGLRFFNLMGAYGIRPNLKHYTCMVDLFGRAGKLGKAFEFIEKMPVEPDAVVWGALLGGCVIHRDVQLGAVAADRLIELERENVGAYVLGANLYSAGDRKEDLARMRRTIGEMRMHKSPGWSWIEEKGRVHVFYSNDTSHARAHEIYAALDNLTSQSKVRDEKLRSSDRVG